MGQRVIILMTVLVLLPAGLMAQQDTTKPSGPANQSIVDSIASKKSIPANTAVIDSNDDNNFLELYYYGPDMDGGYDIYDPWDIYPDREGDSRERDNDDRDSQERDTRQE